ncbi:MAG: hypothetical protein IJL60_08105 [Clostridiales bacterium]|nr:hypothetical protein [Clostridiales bacterium]
MKKSQRFKKLFDVVVLFAMVLSITSCSYLPKKTTEQTTDASIEQSTTEEPTTSETLDLSGYYFLKHPIQEESGSYESKTIDIDVENEWFFSQSVLTYNDFFCFLTWDYSSIDTAIIHEFDYNGNLICATELHYPISAIAKFSDTSAIIQVYMSFDENDLTTEYEYYEFDFLDHSMRKLGQFDGIDGSLLDYENDKAFFYVEHHIECYDNDGKLLYQTGSLSNSYPYTSYWYVIDGTVYAKFYDEKTTKSYRLMKYDESGERIYNEEFPSTGLESISSSNDIVSMADQEGCWVLDEDSFTWTRVLTWQNKETSLVTDFVQTAVSNDKNHILIWNEQSLFLLVKKDGNAEDNSIVLAGFHDALTYTRRYNEFSWDEEPFPIIYDDVYMKNYLDASGKTKPDYEIEDELINDFKNGDIDVLFLTDLTNETMNYDPSVTLRKAKKLEFEGYCMDLSQFIEPYVDESNEWTHPIPVSLYSEYASAKGLFAIPAGLPRVEGLYAKKNIKLGAEDSYAEWLEYAENKASDKPFLYYSPAGWVAQCLGYDLDAFIDFETNQAHFDCLEFESILVMAAQHTGFDTVLTNATKPLSTAYLSNRYIFDRLESDISDLKKVGVPSISGTGLYMNSDVIILVSSQCKNPQLAWKTIESYLDWCKEYDEYAKWSKNEGEELQNVSLVINPDPEILDIVYQETDAYFYDNQSFEKTAAAINERVNELLNKRN